MRKNSIALKLISFSKIYVSYYILLYSVRLILDLIKKFNIFVYIFFLVLSKANKNNWNNIHELYCQYFILPSC